MKENEYVIQLKKLVHQIKSNTGRLEPETAKLVKEATGWDPPYEEERKMLTELINRSREYIQLKKIAYRQYLSKELFDKYFSYERWFNSLNMLLDTFDVPLRDVSLNDLSLKEG